jgi:ABC-2 type transport system ATP-binding protein
LAVGDEAFQQKCMDRIFHMKREGTSILLVSHDLSSIERLMDQAVWISNGVMQKVGVPREVILAYRQSLMDQNAESQENSPETTGDGHSQSLLRVITSYLSTQGKRADTFQSGDPVDIHIELSNDSGKDFSGHVSLAVTRPDGLELASFSTVLDGTPMHFKPGVNQLSMAMANFYLTTGEYEVTFAVYDDNGRRLDEWPAFLLLRVQSMTRAPGLLVLPHAWRVE